MTFASVEMTIVCLSGHIINEGQTELSKATRHLVNSCLSC